MQQKSRGAWLEFKLWLVQATATGGKLKLELQFANFEP
jgi:hypothetical protein